MPLETVRLPAERLQAIFNQYYEERLIRGDLQLVELSSRPVAKFEPGTRSVMYEIYDPRLLERGSAVKVAVVHAYVRPDGSLAASGRYDPKAVRVGRKRYLLG